MRRGVLGLLGAILVLTACGGGDDDDAGNGRSGGGSQESSTTTTGGDGESTTSTSPAEGPEEWIEVAREINERDFELLQDPDPARVEDLYSAECGCLQDELDTVQWLADNGWHMEGAPPNVLAVQHLSTDEVPLPDEPETTITFVSLVVMGSPNTLQVVDAQGNVQHEYPAEGIEPGCTSFRLRLEPDGVYRVVDNREVECPAEWG